MKRIEVKIIFYCLCFGVILSCSQERNEFNQFESIFSRMGKSDFLNTQAIIVIPKVGCDGCISSSVYFVLDNFDTSQDFNIIFTGIDSKKALRTIVGESIVESDRVFVDDNNLFYTEEFFSVYPSIYYIKNSKVVKLRYQSPDFSNSLDSLKLVLHL